MPWTVCHAPRDKGSFCRVVSRILNAQLVGGCYVGSPWTTVFKWAAWVRVWMRGPKVSQLTTALGMQYDQY